MANGAEQEPRGVLTGNFAQNMALLSAACHARENEDVVVHPFTMMGREAAVFYVDGMAEDAKVQKFLLMPCLEAKEPPEETALADYLCRQVVPMGSLTPTTQAERAAQRIFSGDVALICDGMPCALMADVKGFVKRGVGEPINESVIIGPHEGFNESLRDNVVLLRRMLRTPSLISEQLSVGTKIPTRLSLVYLTGVAREETLQELRRRIAGCNVDYVSSIGMLEQLIEDKPFSLFPQVVTTERPDRAVSFLNEGQVVIVMENAPSVLIMPISVVHLFHAPDDTGMRWQYGTFLRLLRMAGILISLLLPAVFVSLTVFHPEGMPLSLITSVIESQSRVPLSLFTSMLLMLLVFSLINEAGARVPGAMGGSFSIVSGLILGQAAVDADLLSPLLIIVVAISGLGSYAVPSFPLTLSLRIAQFFLVLASGIAGYLGMVLGLFFILMRLAGLTSLHYPYLAPVAPRRVSNPDTLLRLPIWRQRLRGYIANPAQMERAQGRMRAWDRPKK